MHVLFFIIFLYHHIIILLYYFSINVLSAWYVGLFVYSDLLCFDDRSLRLCFHWVYFCQPTV